MPLSQASFLPLSKGVVDSGNPSLNLTGAVRAMGGFDVIGAGKLVTRAGTQTVLTFKDDQGTPANVTSVCGVWQFKDKAVVVAHSTGQTDAYLYVLTADLTDWYDSTGALQGTTSPEPVAVIWSGITTSPDVFVAEGLGTLYLAHAQGCDATALNFVSTSWDGAFPVSLTTLTADLDGAGGAEDLYFTGLVAFQNHLWAWGFGGGTTASTGYDPSKARFSAINFGSFAAADSITVGNRVKSDRERIINGGIAGNALILQGSYITTRVTGYGRSSWYREVVDESSGITGPKAGVSDRGYWYFWSFNGPARVGPSDPVEDLSSPVKALVASVVNPEKIVAAREVDRDLVVFYVDTGSGVRTRVAYHTGLNVWLASDDDIGVVIRGAGEVAPIIQSTAAGVAPPSAAPTTPASTTSVSTASATANWTNGDATAQTQFEYRKQGAASWTVATLVPAGTATAGLTGLDPSTAYEWRVAHYKGGQYSTYYGPTANTQFTTSAGGSGGLNAPVELWLEELSLNTIYLTWGNGESSGNTEVELAPDASGAPGTYSLKTTVAIPASSTTINTPSSGGAWWVRIRHVRGSDTSGYSSDATITLS